MKAGDFAKDRKSYSDFDDKWDSIEDLIKARSADSYTEIEKTMIQIENALKPDVDQVTTLAKGVREKYNAVVADITKDARAHPAVESSNQFSNEIGKVLWAEGSDAVLAILRDSVSDPGKDASPDEIFQ